jgi:Effector-associated domain 11
MKDTLQNLLAKGKTGQVIKDLLSFTANDTDLNQQVTLLSAQFTDYERQARMGLEDRQTLNTQLARINKGLLEVMSELKENDLKASNHIITTNEAPISIQSFSWSKWTGLTDVKSWIAVLAGLAGILTFYFKYGKTVPENDGKPFSVVIYTHGTGGKQDIINLKETKLVADFGGRRELAKVGENGQNTFNEVPAQFRNKRIGIGLQGTEGYVLSYQDSTYLLDGNPIYLAIQSSCRFCKIEGIVRNQKQIIPNAIVNTGSFIDTTDSNGYFDINIPPDKEQSEYPVTVRVKGKIVWDKFITPNPKQPAEILIHD